MINGIIFDWSGVVKDCVLDQFACVNKIFAHFGVQQITLKEFQENWRQPYMDFYHKYMPQVTREEEQEVYRRVSAENPRAKEYPGISDFIKKLKQLSKKVCVLSSDAPNTILPEMEQFGLDGIFDDMVINAYHKEEGLYELIQRNNFNKTETVFIGDSNHEIELGKKAGIKTLAVTWGFSSESSLRDKNPDFIVHNIKELENILL